MVITSRTVGWTFTDLHLYYCFILTGTSNQLTEQQGSGYEHITVVRDLAPPDLNLLRFIDSEIPPGTVKVCGTYLQ